MVCLSRLYSFKFVKGCLPQIFLGPFLNTLYQLYRRHLGKTVLVSLENNRAIFLGTIRASVTLILSVSLENSHGSLTSDSRASVTWKQSCQLHLGAVLPLSLGNNRVSVTWEQLCHSDLGLIVSVSFGNNRATSTEKIFEKNSSFHVR